MVAHRWKLSRVGLFYVLLTALFSCDRDEHAPPRPLDDSVIAFAGSSPPLPLSLSDDLTEVYPDYVCTFDSFEVQIACAARGGREVDRFGREGRGPGELGGLGMLVGGPDETAGFIDIRNQRITLFSAAGYVGELRKPAGLLVFADDIAPDSTYMVHNFPGTGGPPVLNILNTREHPDSGNWRLRLEFDPRELDANPDPREVLMTGVVRLRSGRFVARIQWPGRLGMALYDGEGGYVGLLRFPHSPPAYPSESDVETYIAEGRLIGRTPGKAKVEEFRRKPFNITPRQSMYRIIQESENGWLWVLTTRRSPAGTDIDVFDGTKYLGTVTLQDRVRGIQIREDRLLALVEIEHPDQLEPTRRVDWYKISPS